MVTAVTLTPPAMPETGAQPGMLSDLAQEALSGIGKMQTEYSEGMRAAQVPIAQSSDMGTMAADLARQMQASVRVQAHLAQFMMTSSVSSTMGNNLNTFLKGQ